MYIVIVKYDIIIEEFDPIEVDGGHDDGLNPTHGKLHYTFYIILYRNSRNLLSEKWVYLRTHMRVRPNRMVQSTRYHLY